MRDIRTRDGGVIDAGVWSWDEFPWGTSRFLVSDVISCDLGGGRLPGKGDGVGGQRRELQACGWLDSWGSWMDTHTKYESFSSKLWWMLCVCSFPRVLNVGFSYLASYPKEVTVVAQYWALHSLFGKCLPLLSSIYLFFSTTFLLFSVLHCRGQFVFTLISWKLKFSATC